MLAGCSFCGFAVLCVVYRRDVVFLLNMGYHRCQSSLPFFKPPADAVGQDTLQRKVNTSDASEYATMIGCCSSRFWGESRQYSVWVGH
jgi:hypothetical protein